jgi:hypothetical protein
MTDKDEALRLALEALELMYACYAHPDWVSHKQQEEKILAQCVATTMTLRQAIKAVLLSRSDGEAQTRSVVKDEPVVWNGGVPAMLPKQKEGETFIVSYEPKQEAKDEPVAWISPTELLVMRGNALGGAKDWRVNVGLKPEDGDVGLYTSPPQRTWVGLKDEEIASVEYNNHPLDGIRSFARAIEAKLKEKNGYA